MTLIIIQEHSQDLEAIMRWYRIIKRPIFIDPDYAH